MNIFSFLRNHPVISVFALLSIFVFLLVLIAVYSSPPQTIKVGSSRRKPANAAPEPVFAPAAMAPAAMAVLLPGMSKRAERVMGAVFVAIGVALSVMVLRVVR